MPPHLQQIFHWDVGGLYMITLSLIHLDLPRLAYTQTYDSWTCNSFFRKTFLGVLYQIFMWMLIVFYQFFSNTSLCYSDIDTNWYHLCDVGSFWLNFQGDSSPWQINVHGVGDCLWPKDSSQSYDFWTFKFWCDLLFIPFWCTSLYANSEKRK